MDLLPIDAEHTLISFFGIFPAFEAKSIGQAFHGLLGKRAA
jgi:hypothetical protein